MPQFDIKITIVEDDTGTRLGIDSKGVSIVAYFHLCMGVLQYFISTLNTTETKDAIPTKEELIKATTQALSVLESVGKTKQ